MTHTIKVNQEVEQIINIETPAFFKDKHDVFSIKITEECIIKVFSSTIICIPNDGTKYFDTEIKNSIDGSKISETEFKYALESCMSKIKSFTRSLDMAF